MKTVVRTAPRRRCLALALLAGCGGKAAVAPAPSPAPAPSAAALASATSPLAPVRAAETSSTATNPPAADAGPAVLTSTAIPLPGAVPPVTLDYIAYDPAHARVWVPVGDTGSVDVLDVRGGATGAFVRVNGFPTASREVRGRKRVMGPSAAAVGDGVVYIGNRGTSEVCAVDAATLTRGACLKLTSSTDGVAYVATSKEVWVTTPRDDAIVVLDASTPSRLKVKTTLQLAGAPEGYAVDESRHLFFTNLEDKNRTVSIDVVTHEPRSAWAAQCGPSGPRGIAADAAHGFVLVACTDHLEVLAEDRNGAVVSELDTGPGVDNIEWSETRRLLYVAAAKAAVLIVARVGEDGQLTVVATGKSADGARNAVVDASGRVYLPDPESARVLVFPPIP